MSKATEDYFEEVKNATEEALENYQQAVADAAAWFEGWQLRRGIAPKQVETA
jgi:hypothetical protein